MSSSFNNDDAKLAEQLRILCDSYGSDESGALLNVLSDIVDRYRYVPPVAFEVIEEKFDVRAAVATEVCRRSSSYPIDPVGEIVVCVCDGTVCHNRGSSEIRRAVEALLGIQPGQTSEDGRFTLRLVSCVGSCSRAPLMQIGSELYGQVRSPEVSRLLKEYEGDLP